MTGRVRPAVDVDARAIAEVHVRAWRWAYRGLLPGSYIAGLSVDARERMWRGKLADDDARAGVLVWEQDGRIRGFVAYAPASGDEPDAQGAGKLAAIYVDEEIAGRGAGRALHDAALAAMRAAGFASAVLWVLEDNSRGRVFYEQQGWAPDGRQKSSPFGDEHRIVIRLARSL
jgi:GNAT superfamily N-acetyltransferase